MNFAFLRSVRYIIQQGLQLQLYSHSTNISQRDILAIPWKKVTTTFPHAQNLFMCCYGCNKWDAQVIQRVVKRQKSLSTFEQSFESYYINKQKQYICSTACAVYFTVHQYHRPLHHHEKLRNFKGYWSFVCHHIYILHRCFYHTLITFSVFSDHHPKF